MSQARRRVHQGVLKPLRRPLLWLGLWLLAVALVVVLSLVPPPQMPMPQHGDKVEHLLAYAVLAAGLVQVLVPGRTLVLAGAGLVLLGVALEWMQGSFTATRQPDIADAVANTVGVILGLLSAVSPWRDALLRLERRIGGG
ncbi:VanZ family protein [Pseudoxanthomonas koreensis]|uniref:VanZ family protein n=1 Tax=Pseudoxanthomonas koreensis TaxID=266061 RepID=UPI0035A710EA